MKQAIDHLKQNGYAIIPRFINPNTCDRAINEINRLINEFQPSPQSLTIFDAGNNKESHKTNKYFLDSADKVSFFYEAKAFKDGKLVVPKLEAINKIGHSLHQKNPIFEEITYASGVEEICFEAGIQNPLVVQSMAILKPSRVGGKVSMHQDSTYLHCEPDSLLGFWIPLQDATVKNGCLWGLPGSHKGHLYSRSNLINGVSSEQILHEVDYRQEDYIPLEMERGSLVIFTGLFLHKSNQNVSDKSRYAYTWHLRDERSRWLSTNWLQRPFFPKFPLKNKYA